MLSPAEPVSPGRRNLMKWLAVLLLSLGILTSSVGTLAARFQDKDKEEKKEDKDGKKDGDKDKKDGDKKKDDKDKKEDADKDGKKDKDKEEVKLTPAQEKDIKALTGTFVVEKYVREGKEAPKDEVKKMKVVQTGSKWRFFVGEDITLGSDTVAPDKDPKEIDSLYENGPAREKTAKGIYKISADGNEVTYCHADPGKDRPKSFDSGKEGSGIVLIVLKRQKDEPIDDDDKKDKAKDKDGKDKAKKDGKDKDKKDDKDKKKDKDD
jgi:uncharacterized protein (TIGR03067 family)